MNRVTSPHNFTFKTKTGIFFGNIVVTFVLYAATHPVTILMLLAFAKLRGYNALMCYLPISLVNFVAGIVTILFKFTKNKQLQTTRESYASINVKHYVVLGFVYCFGYLVPTIRLI